jgi:hypothetical protein
MSLFIDIPRESSKKIKSIRSEMKKIGLANYKKKLDALILEDPNFLDPYVYRINMHRLNDNHTEVIALTEKAALKAKEILSKSRWNKIAHHPNNHHIIEALISEALLDWEDEQEEDALQKLNWLYDHLELDKKGCHYMALAIENDINREDFFKEFPFSDSDRLTKLSIWAEKFT